MLVYNSKNYLILLYVYIYLGEGLTTVLSLRCVNRMPQLEVGLYQFLNRYDIDISDLKCRRY